MADGMIGQRIGASPVRVDGRAKVTGTAHYPSDMAVPNPAWAFLVTAAIARGRIVAIHEEEARRVPGVLDILTHANMQGAIKDPGFFAAGGYGGTTIVPMQGDRVLHDGQVIGVV